MGNCSSISCCHPRRCATNDSRNQTFEIHQELSVRSQPVTPLRLWDFRCCAILGSGHFGKVLLAEHKSSKKMVAIKALKKRELVKEKQVSRILCEKRILQTASSAQHPFLVNLIASFQDKDGIYLTMEYAAGGDLKTLSNRMDGGFPEHVTQFNAACIVLGVEFLHENNIAHRDLKLANIVLDHHGFAKITDFGLSKAGMGLKDRTTSICGTLEYMAPEIINRRSYTRVVDWWSLGVMVYEMLAGRRPFIGRTKQQLGKNITKSVTYLPCMSPEAVLLIRALLKKNPAARLGGKQHDVALMKQQPFFASIDWNGLLSRQVRPPYIPSISGPEDVTNFSSQFTSTFPDLTFLRGQDISPEEQEAFEGFEWIAEGAL